MQGRATRDLVVYLCDGKDLSQWMNGKTAGTQATLSRNGACVELTIANNGVSGAVTQAGQDAQPFSAVPATGDAGIYRAEWSMAGASYRINWIVLADGSQREIPT